MSDAIVSDVALCSALNQYGDLIELKLPKSMVTRILPAMAKIRPNADEMALLLLCASKRRNAAAPKLCDDALIQPHIKNIECAIVSTLREPLPARAWLNPSTKLVCIYAFHMSESPLGVLNSVFGSVVRSDIRRCEDLHDMECGASQLDTLAMCRVVECLSSLLVL